MALLGALLIAPLAYAQGTTDREAADRRCLRCHGQERIGTLNPAERLSMEQTAGEVVWAAGRTLDAVVVAKAFGIANPAALRRDVAPLAAHKVASTARTKYFAA